jgi:hypothetical protein
MTVPRLNKRRKLSSDDWHVDIEEGNPIGNVRFVVPSFFSLEFEVRLAIT